MESPNQENIVDVIRKNFKDQAITIDQDKRLTPDQKLSEDEALMDRYNDAEINIPLRQQYTANPAFELFYLRVERRIKTLRRKPPASA